VAIQQTDHKVLTRHPRNAKKVHKKAKIIVFWGKKKGVKFLT
jgi:hypothetical protein